MKTLILSTLIIMFTCITSCTKDDDTNPSPNLEIGVSGDGLLPVHTQNIIDESGVPAISGMSIKSGNILESVELGLQKFDGSNPILPNSKWHIGSITKSMTATLTGILIENNYLSWNTKIGDITTEGYLEDYQNVTILELLSMTAGITAEDYPVNPSDSRSVSEIRQEWAITALNLPKSNSGEFVYSNSSYVIVGVMLELIMEDTWENLITIHLFNPLNMNDTGFGAPGNSGNGNQPWGHRHTGNSWTPKNPTDIYSDNPKALGPAGTVHTTLQDMAKYVNLHLGKTNLISNETLDILHSEVNNSGYALGWNVTPHGITHAGSNTNFFAQLYINLDAEFANFSVTNSYDLDAQISVPAVQGLMSVLGQRHENSL
ncbi:serine hydrolase [Hyunsoonleella sp. SJ7]|uniref:Serine hydrolase n=1 Tax=Hyunsoonleella aquatilis TaxID=2762758 RepID=A0A923HBE7_9FLAO|nr:serine hydrolase domain-containing protein [Hyunsoonleella aquatilis]MBC3758174.1 serine hydrolase [Hyunsoonleella aquatilis]